MASIRLRRVCRLLPSLLAFLSFGCGGCEQPDLAPRGPVEGRLPLPNRAVQRPVTPAHQACAVLGFPSIDDGEAPLEVQFDAEGDCTEGEPVFAWSFGDDSPTATGLVVVHTFEKPGTYIVRVEVKSTVNPDLHDHDDFEIVVRAVPTPAAG